MLRVVYAPPYLMPDIRSKGRRIRARKGKGIGFLSTQWGGKTQVGGSLDVISFSSFTGMA